MRRSFVGLTLAQSGFLLGLSPAIVGFALGRQLGLPAAVGSIVVGCWLTVALGAVAATMGWRYRAPTAELAVALLGRCGGRLLGLALAAAFVGWLRIHALAIEAAAGGDVPLATALLVGCAALSAAMVQRGNGWLVRLSAVQAPALVILFVYALGTCTSAGALAVAWPHWPSALLILAAGLSDVVDVPTRMHQAQSLGAAIGSVACTYGVVLPAMLVFGALLGQASAAPDLVAALAAGGPVYAYAVKMLLVTSATVANAGLLWSGSASLAVSLQNNNRRALRWSMASCGLVLSLGAIGASIEAVLAVLGTGLAAVGLVMQTAFVAGGAKAQHVAPALRRAHGAAALAAAGCGMATLAASRTFGFAEAWGVWVGAAGGVGFCLLLRILVHLRGARA